MNSNIIEGKWDQVKGDIQKRWGKLTDDDMDVVEGNRKKLSGVLQERYGKAQDEIERELDEWEKTFAA